MKNNLIFTVLALSVVGTGLAMDKEKEAKKDEGKRSEELVGAMVLISSSASSSTSSTASASTSATAESDAAAAPNPMDIDPPRKLTFEEMQAVARNDFQTGNPDTISFVGRFL